MNILINLSLVFLIFIMLIICGIFMFKLWGIFNAVYYGGKKNYFNPFELKARFQFMMFFWPAFFGRKTNFPLEFYYNLKVVKWCLLAIIILMFIAAII